MIMFDDISDLNYDVFTISGSLDATTLLVGELQEDIENLRDDLTTMSGVVDGKLDSVHDHDGVYQPTGSYVASEDLTTLSGALQAEIDAIDSGPTTSPVIVCSGGGTLTAYRINELQSSSTFTLPSVSSIDTDGWVLVELADTYSSLTPTVSGAGSDTIRYSEGYDTSILFDAGIAFSMRFISNGVSQWRI